MQAGITDDTLHTPHIFPYIPGVLPTNSQILTEDNVECSPTVSLSEKSADEATSVIESEVCSAIKLGTPNETPGLMKDDVTTSGKNDILSPNIIVASTNPPIAPKLLPTTPTPHL